MKYDVLEVPSKEATEYLKVDDECKQYYDKLNKETNGEVLVDAETGDQIGHAFVYNSGSNKGFIFNIQVNPRYRGYGFGKKLLDDCVKKYGGIDLTVDCDNSVAVNMYLKYGFAVDEIINDDGKKQYWMSLKKDKNESLRLYIKETFRNLSSDTYITKDPMDIDKKCRDTQQPYRILYDAQTDLYMIGGAWDIIHQELLDAAFEQGWYDSQREFCQEFIGYYSRRSSTDYWCRGTEVVYFEEEELDTSLLSDKVNIDDECIYPWLYCYGFLPVGNEDAEDLLKDGYNHDYEYTFGTLYTRDFEIHETPDLQRAFERLSV